MIFKKKQLKPLEQSLDNQHSLLIQQHKAMFYAYNFLCYSDMVRELTAYSDNNQIAINNLYEGDAFKYAVISLKSFIEIIKQLELQTCLKLSIAVNKLLTDAEKTHNGIEIIKIMNVSAFVIYEYLVTYFVFDNCCYKKISVCKDLCLYAENLIPLIHLDEAIDEKTMDYLEEYITESLESQKS